VYRFALPDISIIAVNDYMCDIMQFEKKLFEQQKEDGVMAPVEDEDAEIVHAFVGKLTTGEGGVAETEYRLRSYLDQKPMWFHVSGRSIRQKDGAYLVYMVYTEISKKQEKQQRQEVALQTAKREAAEEAQKNERLAEMMDSISAGIVVGQFVGMAGKFTSVNKYFCNILGLTEDEILGREDSGDLEDGRTKPGLLEAIHPDDMGIVLKYFSSLCEGQGREAQEVFRLKTVKEPSGQYFTCRSRTIKKADGVYVIYSIYTDATDRQRQKAEFDRLLQDLLVTNPHSRCAYHLNLTRNLCSDCHGATEFVRHILDSSSADELIERVETLIIDKRVLEDFRKNCNRRRLIERYSEGEVKFSIVYRRKTENKKYLWVQTFYHLMQNPTTGDIEAIAYTVDIDRQMREEQLMAQLAAKSFYAYGTVEVASHMVEHYYIEDADVSSGEHNYTVEDGLFHMVSRIETDTERDDFKKHTDTAYVCGMLENNDVYTYAFTLDKRRMQITYRYLDEMEDMLSFMVVDITETIAKQEESMQMLRDALTAAESANSAKTDFLSRMSHDIRTPMNAILGFTTLILQEPGDAEKVEDRAQKIELSGKHLLGLINDVLDMSKIESGTANLNAQEMSLKQTLATVENIIRPQTEDRGQDFVVDITGLDCDDFVADEQRIEQVLLNILSNAVKYTEPGGHIVLRAEAMEDTGKKFRNIMFEVEDDGRGMTQEYMTTIFEPFTREELKGQEKAQGTGLGMAITRNLVNMMGGSISVRSELEQGSIFTIVLPLTLADKKVEREVAAEDDVVADISGLKILAAEDNEINAEILNEVLTSAGASCHIENNGEELKNYFAGVAPGEYDLILMDVQMPVMDGYEATMQIRTMANEAKYSAYKRHEAATIPIIAMTANAFSDDIRKALDSGMNAHVSKPLDMETLKRTIRKFVPS